MLSDNQMTETSQREDHVELAKVKILTLCDTCVNKRICKYTEDVLRYKEAIESSGAPEILEVTLKCKYFKGDDVGTTKRAVSTPIRGRESGIQIKHTIKPIEEPSDSF